MFRGLWLWFEKGVSAARVEKISVGCSSSCVKCKGICSGSSSAPFSRILLAKSRS